MLILLQRNFLKIIVNVKRKLNILQVLPSLNSGGVEKGTLEIADYLLKKGHTSFVISGGGRLVEKLVFDGSRHLKLNIGKKSPFTLFLIPILLAFILKNKIDIIHARSRLPAWIVYITLKLIPKSKRPYFVTTVHGLNSISWYSKIMTLGDKVIVVSKFIQKFIADTYYTDINKVYLIHRGVPINLKKLSQVKFRKWNKKFELEINNIRGNKILSISARLSRTKGIEIFINLINKLILDGKKIHGLIVGEAKSENYLNIIRKKIKILGIENHISILGYRPDVYEILQYSDISFCLSELPEPFGRGVIESIKIGTPVIGFDIGGAGEQLRDIFPEGLIKKNDFNALYLKTNEFLFKKPVIKKTNLYSLELMQKKTLDLYLSFYKK